MQCDDDDDDDDFGCGNEMNQVLPSPPASIDILKKKTT